MNVPSLLRTSARRDPQTIALRFGPGGREAMSYETLDRAADTVAAWLSSSGVERGDRVALAMSNTWRFAAAYFGALRAGMVVVPLNGMLTEPEVAQILDDSGARALIAAGPPASTATAGAEGRTPLILTPEIWDRLPSESPPEADVSEDDLAVIAYTSGTTGNPKGAMLTHGNLLANLEQQMAIPEANVRSDDVILLALPLFHIYGLNVGLGLLALNGASGVLVEGFESIEALRLIQEHRVTVLFGAPPMYVAWVATPGADQYDLSSVRLAVSGAAPLQPEVLFAFRELFGVDVYEGYGLTETSPTLASNRMAPDPRPGSVGKPLPGVELRLVGEDGSDVDLGDLGEIVVRGANVFVGYWNKPDETESAMRDGWFHTGDVAVQDEDGYIYLVDRKRDLIIVSGFNVFPAEVEAALAAHPYVREAAVVGAPHPYTGEAISAFVVRDPGSDLTEEELLRDVHSRLARFKCPDSISFVEELPHVLSGKVLRRALRTGSV